MKDGIVLQVTFMIPEQSIATAQRLKKIWFLS